MAADIKEQFGIEATLVKGRDGVFEVTLGDELVFSKRELGRFPEPAEVETSIASSLGA